MITKWLSMIRINGLDPLLPVTDPGGRPIIHFTLYGSHTNDLISDHLCAIEQNWFLPPKYHHNFYVHLSERTLWLWFWNYSCLYLAQLNYIENGKHFANVNLSVMNDISNTNYHIEFLWWYIGKKHSQKSLQPLQVIIVLELCKV